MIRTARLALAALVLAAACGDDDDPATPAAESWTATLNGANEVPPAATNATGSATFTAVGDTAIQYSLSATGLTAMTMAHIHTGAAGSNGGVMVWLQPPNGTAAGAPAPANGVFATGRINQSWIRGLSGQPPITLDSLRRLMRSGNAYVNVHSSTFPGGEIRGQIRSQ